jgi:hypothetical protein
MTAPNNAPFVPLAPAAGAGTRSEGFQVLVAARPENARSLREAALSSSKDSKAQAPGSNCVPRITLEREGDRISAIHIQCSCGQVIDLACAYEATPPAPTGKKPK